MEKQIWNNLLQEIKKKINNPQFETWIKPCELIYLDDNKVVIRTKTEFSKDWLDERYTNLISDTLEELTGIKKDIQFIY
ncbi:DnaA N-terminal domain-containing protein [Neobacillus soli]|uniref:DnaA N-terminal domain-containing protein n=1 Tax=Neobacillus soli TaxID=220688 RepID=UPI0008251C64|nr:DnaA N-terminal domain-containing protein [Neobacillus soli]